MTDTIRPVLAGTRPLVIGLASDQSIAKAFRAAGAELAITWLRLELNPVCSRDGSGEASRIQAWVVPTNKELMIARHTAALRA